MKLFPRSVQLLPTVSFVVVLCFAALGAAAQPSNAPEEAKKSGLQAGRPLVDPAAGEAAFKQSCARCHGVTGAGDGIDSKRFYPRPRDFTKGIYKFRSTASGTPPSDDDLFHTITYGLPGSNMPDWQHLDESTRWHIVDYLKSLSPVFQQTPSTPVTLGPDPGPKRDMAKGKQLFTQLGCVACHGPNGRANGTSAATLTDDWGLPLRPADLTLGWNYRGGSAPRDIAMRLTAGIDGAGMPSYAEAISPEDAWHLAYYVASLQEPPQWRMVNRVTHISGELPTTIDDGRWTSADRADVQVRNVVTPQGEWAHPPTVRVISIRALRNDEAIALLVAWDDPTQEQGSGVTDRLAILFKPADARGDVVTLQAWPYRGSPALDACIWAAGSSPVEMMARDIESLEKPSTAAVPLPGTAAYEDGRWKLVVRRPLHPAAPADAATLGPELFGAVAFMVWDGGNPESRAISPWTDLSMQDATAHHKH